MKKCLSWLGSVFWVGFSALTLACAEDAPGSTAGDAAAGSGGNGPRAGGSQREAGWASATLQASTEACPGLVYEENVTVANTASDRFSFGDLDCRPRSASLARDQRGYLRQFTYEYDGKVRTATGTGVNGWDGWGFIVNHGLSGGGGSTDSSQHRSVFVGAHHAIYEYTSTRAGITITRQWFFASGRDHPIVAITYDMNAVAPGIGADTRTPYGDIAWDGDEYFPNTVVSGVGWGDRYKFVTTQAPLTLNSSWDYQEPNLVPYCFEWADLADAEMGIVQTQTYQQKDGGGYWHYKNWGKDSSTQLRDEGQVGEMPISWNWTYQLNQYELCYEQGSGCVDTPTNSHRISWGTNYGAIGGNDASGTYPAYGDDKKLVGYPFNSYSVFMVLGKHSEAAVLEQVSEIETVQKTTLTASVGSVLTELWAGVARSDVAALEPPGYDARYSTWNVAADANRAAFNVTVSEGALRNPIVVVSNFTAAAIRKVTVDGISGVADVDYLASVDAQNHLVWLTFRPGWEGTRQISIE